MHGLLKTAKTSLRALKRNTMRTMLTALGIIIGIAAVIALAQIGKGSSNAVREQIKRMGANKLMVNPGAINNGGISLGSGTRMSLTFADATAIERDCPDVRWAAPIVHAHGQVIHGQYNWQPNLIDGTTSAYLHIRNWMPLKAGRTFTRQEVRSAAEVCILGQTLIRHLFPSGHALGKTVRLDNVSLRVIGVLTRKGANMMGWDQDDILVAPWTTIKYRIPSGKPVTAAASTLGGGINTLNQLYPETSLALYTTPSATETADTPDPTIFMHADLIMCSAVSSKLIPAAIREIDALLRQRHHLTAAQGNDFTVRPLTALSNMLTTTTNLMTHLLLGVAFISLVVGGVGIMNIMLVSVTERTREIGLRMAVGARGRDILQQFLMESIVLCLLGGALGIALGQGVATFMRVFLQWPTAVSVRAIIAAVAVSAAVGLVFGYYPAWKASRLDPIEALRYE